MLLDMQMPEMTGVQVIKQVKRVIEGLNQE
jgi:CheY-like chemotaxis protein